MGEASTDIQAAEAGPELTVAGVRGRIAASDLAAAREMYEALTRRLGPIADVRLTGVMLDEAEGRLDTALASLHDIVAAAPRSIHARALSARVLLRLGRAEEAEAAALTALELDAANLIGLTVLAEVYAKAGRPGDRLDVVYRAAQCPGTPSAGVWSAIAELAGAQRWEDILRVLDRRADLPAAQRMVLARAEAQLALGRHGQAVSGLLEALARGHAPAKDAADRLVARHALIAAARFVEAAIKGGQLTAAARQPVIAEARRTCEATSLEASPLDYADAVRALEILCPEEEGWSDRVTRAAAFLVERAAGHQARGDFAVAADHLALAARLRPRALDILRPLADAAARAGRVDRHADTLARIHRESGTPGDRQAAADAALAAGHWAVLAALMTQPPGAQASAAAARLLPALRARLEDLGRRGDREEALAMVAALAPWIAPHAWPPALISRLLRAAKRRMRAPRTTADPAALGRLCAAFLAIEPTDADVGRVMARLHLRHHRFGEAAALFAGALDTDPHVARDWIDLALAHHALGEVERRDACVAHALVITPTIPLPAELVEIGIRMNAANP
jgi:tetratricopeptide (TPR) repeat protein